MDDPGTAIVTGGASGIGLATVHRLLVEGWSVVAADRDPDALERVEPPADARLHLARLDVTDERAVDALVRTIAPDVGPIHGVVNCAGIGNGSPFLDTSAQTFQHTLQVNLVGTFLVGRAVARIMRDSGGGSIVNIASVSGLRGSPGRTAYSASKGGVIALTNVMAVELGEYGIRVNCVAPGATDTPLVRAVHTPEVRAAITQAVPLGRYAQPEEIAGAISFLLDAQRSSFVTGQTLGVDGGQLAGAGWSLPRRSEVIG
ncbi:SDR family oxidoreductase [Micromonospora sp. NBC_00898]|uniref:SDR family NAD(P)-dependent oxidoreductase n=1 Tax=Micromonospora sp. NBC_00898 TaxID=2975981 RepID=UPI0038685CC6|nr:SDR family oxidoreductase [Micromonospora sp. NBC_00898]